MEKAQFQKLILDFYVKNRRDLPWRAKGKKRSDPYAILVSEVMLQQTQASRVVPKFLSFMKAFPTVQKLAYATTQEVLKEWQGLGYNRRGLFLHNSAKEIVARFGGIVPRNPEALESLPGIGPYTARAILAFAYNVAHPFIETNIRSVYIHHFFEGSAEKITDKELLKVITDTLPKENAREWYAALMDYGAYLKATLPNPSRRAKAHVKQKAFKGSVREVRGAILRLLTETGKITRTRLTKMLEQFEDERIEKAIEGLKKDGMISVAQSFVSIKK